MIPFKRVLEMQRSGVPRGKPEGMPHIYSFLSTIDSKTWSCGTVRNSFRLLSAPMYLPAKSKNKDRGECPNICVSDTDKRSAANFMFVSQLRTESHLDVASLPPLIGHNSIQMKGDRFFTNLREINLSIVITDIFFNSKKHLRKWFSR